MLIATLAGRPESTTTVFDIGNGAKRAIFPLLRNGYVDVNGTVFEDGAFLANWSCLTLPPRVYVPEAGCDLTITWHNWVEVVMEAYRGAELVLGA